MEKQQPLCTHIKYLTKKVLTQLVNSNINNQCCICYSKFIIDKDNINFEGRLCLHCIDFSCSQKCNRLHMIKKQHIFSCKVPQIKQTQFLIHCHKCNDKLISTYNQSQITQQNGYLAMQKQLERFICYLAKQIYPKLHQKIIHFINNYEKQQELTEQEDQNQYMCGLCNLGNTCYVNTVIQTLFNIKDLRSYYMDIKWGTTITSNPKHQKQLQYFYDQILQKQQQDKWHVVATKADKIKQNRYKSDVYHNSAIISNTKFNQQFTRLMRTLTQAEYSIQPIQFYYKIGQIDHKYTQNRQQDAQQLLYMVLDSLSQGQMLRLPNKQRYQKIEGIIGRQKLTKTQKIFTSYFASHIACQKCMRQSWKLDLTYGLSVPLTKINQIKQSQFSQKPIPNITYYKQLYYPVVKKSKKFPKFIQPLFRQQKLTYGNNYWVCQKCQGLQALKKTYLLQQPSILIISFKRFDHRNIYAKKNQLVEFNDIIDISNYCLKTEPTKEQNSQKKLYKLIGIIVHEGRHMQTGHYICFIRKGRNWFKCSDQKIQMVTWNEVKQCQAYILFYKKKQKF